MPVLLILAAVAMFAMDYIGLVDFPWWLSALPLVPLAIGATLSVVVAVAGLAATFWAARQ